MPTFRDHRLPELYCGLDASTGGGLVRYPVACSPQAWASAAPFLLLQAMLGLHLDGPKQQLTIKNPVLPRCMKRIEIDGLRPGRVGHEYVDQVQVIAFEPDQHVLIAVCVDVPGRYEIETHAVLAGCPLEANQCHVFGLRDAAHRTPHDERYIVGSDQQVVQVVTVEVSDRHAAAYELN